LWKEFQKDEQAQSSLQWLPVRSRQEAFHIPLNTAVTKFNIGRVILNRVKPFHRGNYALQLLFVDYMRACACVCVCERERERERKQKKDQIF